jgi:hypothetical protein
MYLVAIRTIQATAIALLFGYSGVEALAQQPPATSCGLVSAAICGIISPATPQFNNTLPEPTPMPPAVTEVPVSPTDPVPGSTAIGGTVDTPDTGLSPGCTGQVFSATGC